MKEYQRVLDLSEEVKKKTIFLFGPRQTGKTSLLKKQFPDAPYYNLLLSDLFLRLSANPSIIREEILADKNAAGAPVIIDEIQKLPILLDEVHDLIESHKKHFILTGSSPRKLKRGDANLLGGRARVRRLFPLTTREIDDFDLLKAVNYGTIPSIYQSDDPEEDLLSYCGAYLQEEIYGESAVRRIENFSRFLRAAASMNTREMNFEKTGRDLGLPARTTREYFQILEDTLIGSMLQPFQFTNKRKAVSRSKFYFFDIGVANILAERFRISENSELFGAAFEHLILNEIRAWMSYTRNRAQLTYWRDRSGNEVDFLIGDTYAIEVKASKRVQSGDAKGLLTIAEEINFEKLIIVSLDPQPRLMNGVHIMPWQQFCRELWSGRFG